MPIERALEALWELLTENWGIPENRYVLVDEMAYVLQGYRIEGPEVASGHLDVYIDPTSVPWPDKGERSLIPPKDSPHMNQWASFMEATGCGLDLLRAKAEFLETPTVEYRLDRGRKIYLMKAYEMTRLFVEQTILHYSLEDVGKDKMKEWIDKLGLIKNAAKAKGDDKLLRLCDDMISRSHQKWRGLIT